MTTRVSGSFEQTPPPTCSTAPVTGMTAGAPGLLLARQFLIVCSDHR